MEKDDIFNLKQLDDMPINCKKQLKKLQIRGNVNKLLSLFDYKSQLNIDELIVGMYRLYKIEITRTWTINTLYNLKAKKLIKKHESLRGHYEKDNI